MLKKRRRNDIGRRIVSSLSDGGKSAARDNKGEVRKGRGVIWNDGASM